MEAHRLVFVHAKFVRYMAGGNRTPNPISRVASSTTPLITYLDCTFIAHIV
jgi:hypothetical protein